VILLLAVVDMFSSIRCYCFCCNTQNCSEMSMPFIPSTVMSASLHLIAKDFSAFVHLQFFNFLFVMLH
jgi:hypothetical protein